jgi:hypothetical protein
MLPARREADLARTAISDLPDPAVGRGQPAHLA